MPRSAPVAAPTQLFLPAARLSDAAVCFVDVTRLAPSPRQRNIISYMPRHVASDGRSH